MRPTTRTSSESNQPSPRSSNSASSTAMPASSASSRRAASTHFSPTSHTPPKATSQRDGHTSFHAARWWTSTSTPCNTATYTHRWRRFSARIVSRPTTSTTWPRSSRISTRSISRRSRQRVPHPFELAGDVGPCGLIGDLGHTPRFELRGTLAQLRRRAAERHADQHGRAVVQCLTVAIGEGDEMVLVHGEMTALGVDRFDGGAPHGPAGHVVDALAGAFVQRVVDDREPVPHRVEHALVARGLAVVEHRAELQQGAPLRTIALRHRRAEHAVAQLLRDRDTFGA